MTETFVDTSFWLSRLHKKDAHHETARKAPKPPRAVTTWAVLLEVMDAFSDPSNRNLAIGFWTAVHEDAELIVIPLDADLLAKGVAFFQNRPDKAWSLTDCLSFVVMQERGITEALTADHHFEQAGFRALLRGA